MDRRKHWALRLFCVLFTLSVSAAVLPCGIINVHGLFGEVNSSIIIEDTRQEICDLESKDHKKVQNEKGVNIFNVWFEISAAVLCVSFCANLVKLPRGDTIITLKVRMDN